MSTEKVAKMRFALVAVLAALCLVAVNANATFEGASIPDEFDFQYVPEDYANEGLVDPETLLFIPNIFAPIYWVMKGALRTLKGINCSIQGVLEMKSGAQNFIHDVEACGGVVSKQLQSVINACNSVIATSNNIIRLNDQACQNGNYNNETDGTKKTPYFSCFLKMLQNMLQLNNQIRNVISLAKKVPTAATGAGACVQVALSDLTSVFTQFPSKVKTCSKLTS